MKTVEALLFDLDGTLIDSKRDLAQSVRYLQKHYGHALSSEKEVGTFIGDGVTKLVQRALPNFHPSKLEEAVTVFKDHYREHCMDHTDVYPGVMRALKHFREKKMAVVTNKPVRISARILEGLRLSHYFKLVIGGDSLPHKKPHPEPILNTFITMRLRNKKQVVMVGDSPNDIHAGRAAGVLTCGILSNIGDPQKLRSSRPDFIISHMNELMRLFN